MKDVLTKYLQRKKNYEIFWITIKITSALISIFFVFIISTRGIFKVDTLLLTVFGSIFLLILTVTIPRWRKYFKARFDYASKFAEVLIKKTNELSHSLKTLSKKTLPRELYWIDFMIDPSTFRLEIDTHSTNHEMHSNDVENFRNEIKDLLRTEESIITGLEKKGWGQEDKIELSLELIQKWLTYTWNLNLSQEIKSRVTISIKDRNGYFNMKSNRWEDTDFLSGYYLERMFRP